MRPRCVFRYLTRFGINMTSLLPGRRTRLRRVPRVVQRRLVQHFAVEHPHLHAAGAVGRVRGRAGEIDVRAQGVQGHAPLAIGLETGHLRAAEAARAVHADALRAGAHRRRDRLLHRAPERHALLELLGDVLGDELGVQVGALDLLDVQLHLLLGELLHLLGELVHLLALAADHQARTRGLDADRDLLALALDGDARDAGLVQALLQIALDEQVLLQHLGVPALGEPARVPGLHDPEPKPDRIGFLAHYTSLVATVTDTWLMRFRSGVARPCARGSQRLRVGPAPTMASFTYRSSTRTLPSWSAFATADFKTFCTMRAPSLGVNCSVVCACSTELPRIRSRTWLHLLGVMRT